MEKERTRNEERKVGQVGERFVRGRESGSDERCVRSRGESEAGQKRESEEHGGVTLQLLLGLDDDSVVAEVDLSARRG